MNLKSIFDIFKSKGVELTAEELAQFEDTKPVIQPQVPQPDFSHNLQKFEEMKAYFSNELATLKTELKTKDDKIESLIALVQDNETKHKEQLETAKAEIDAKRQKDLEAEIESVLKAAIESHKIAPQDEATKAKFKELLAEKFESTKAIIEGLTPITGEPNPVKTVNNQAPAAITSPAGMASGVPSDIMNFVNSNTGK